jgi:hypothetical protein
MPHDHPAAAALERVIADGSRLAAGLARQADLAALAPVSYSLTPLAVSALSGTGPGNRLKAMKNQGQGDSPR